MNFMWLQLPIANQVCRNFTWFQEVQFGFSAISNDKLIPSCKVVHRHSVLHEPLVRLQDDVVAKPSIDLNIPEHNLSETFCFPEPKTRNGSFVFSTQQVINMDADHTVHDRSRALQVEDAKGVVAVLRQAAAHVEALVKLVPREEQLVRPGSLGPRWCTIVEERERRQRLAS